MTITSELVDQVDDNVAPSRLIKQSSARNPTHGGMEHALCSFAVNNVDSTCIARILVQDGDTEQHGSHPGCYMQLALTQCLRNRHPGVGRFRQPGS